MFVAQKLYEGMAIGELGQTGLITYMRTDSVRVSDAAQAAARAYIGQRYSPAYVPAKPNEYKSKKKTQDAHEAIRPAHVDLTPEKVKPFLKKEEYDLYKLIWTQVHRLADGPGRSSRRRPSTSWPAATSSRPRARSSSSTASWPSGRTAAATRSSCPRPRPERRSSSWSSRSSRNSPSRRPATRRGRWSRSSRPAASAGRAPTRRSSPPSRPGPMSSRRRASSGPTELGMYVTDFLVKYFAKLMEYKFTAHMEEELDQISEGAPEGRRQPQGVSTPCSRTISNTGRRPRASRRRASPSTRSARNAARPLVIKGGRFGRFKACSAYPECKFRESLDKKESKPLDEKCPECGAQLDQKFGRFGPFVACSNYPKCKYIKKDRPVETGIACPLGLRRQDPEAEDAPGQVLLRLQPLSEVPLRVLGRSHRPDLPAVRGEDPLQKEPHQGRAVHLLQEREVRVQGSGAPGEDLGPGRRGRGIAGPGNAAGPAGPRTESGADQPGGTDEQGNR